MIPLAESLFNGFESFKPGTPQERLGRAGEGFDGTQDAWYK